MSDNTCIYITLGTIIIVFIAMGIGDWGLGIGPNPQSPIPKPQTFLIKTFIIYLCINYLSN